jgi:hypothetical protein
MQCIQYLLKLDAVHPVPTKPGCSASTASTASTASSFSMPEYDRIEVLKMPVYTKMFGSRLWYRLWFIGVLLYISTRGWF